MKSEKDLVKIVITGGYGWWYYQWFLLGFYMLEKRGEVRVCFRTKPLSYLLTLPNTHSGCRLVNHFQRKWEEYAYHLTGFMEFPDGSRKRFAIDNSDAPYMFSEDLLKTVDVYFKENYPLTIEEDAFPLTPEVMIPWIDCAFVDGERKKLNDRGERRHIKNLQQYQSKIKPLMTGPRLLSIGLSYKSLMEGYERYLSAGNIGKQGKLMCYFGNALGPRPEMVDVPDYLWEGDVLGYFGNRISHPNEKRAKVADIIATFAGNDARVISKEYADSGSGRDESLVIPLPEFCAHIAKFQYNFNVSGYCLSTPCRFIESFMVGTAIITDKLAVKWYQPFDEHEVIETIPMGYLPMDQVDWEQLEKDIESLPQTDPERIRHCYEEKWAPDVVARYIVETVKNS